MAEQKYFDFEICGLKRRLPFVKINHFVEKRMEDTEMM